LLKPQNLERFGNYVQLGIPRKKENSS